MRVASVWHGVEKNSCERAFAKLVLRFTLVLPRHAYFGVRKGV
jgi:hypothetical protein